MPYVSFHQAFPACQVPLRSMLPVAELSGPDPDYYLGGGYSFYPGDDHGWYPVQISKAKMYEWTWRVRKWRIVASGHLATTCDLTNSGLPPPEPSYETFDGDFSLDQIISPPAILPWSNVSNYFGPVLGLSHNYVTYAGAYWVCIASHGPSQTPFDGSSYWKKIHGATTDVEAEELVMICSNQRPTSGYVDEIVSGATTNVFQEYPPPPPYPPPVVTTGDALTSASLDFTYYSQYSFVPRWKRNGADFLPRLQFALAFNGGTNSSGYTTLSTTGFSSAFSINPSSPGDYTVDTVNATIDGYTMPLQYITGYSISYGPIDVVETAAVTGFSCSITPHEWYTYDPGDGGGPVWDSSTGAQLRDPFSIQR